MKKTYSAIYDFALFPYALGDALTWNIQTTLRAMELGCDQVDVYLCIDRNTPAFLYQADLIHEGNYQLFFQELLPAFQTHPLIRHLKIYGDRTSLLMDLVDIRKENPQIENDIREYEGAVQPQVSEHDRAEYFKKFIYSHRKLNEWSAGGRAMPLLSIPSGYSGEIQHLLGKTWAAKRVVAVHFRLRRLDLGMGGEHTYNRDASFSEWYTFLQQAAVSHPEVQFVVLGRLQEKPLSILRMPNVASLRPLGMSLGHELALVALADLFLGSSSGFAAMANFTEVPYFITKMGKSPCEAYEIPIGTRRLPFARAHQHLVYEEESAELLEACLQQALKFPARKRSDGGVSASLTTPSDMALLEEYHRLNLCGANSFRYFLDDLQEDAEVMYLLQKDFDQARDELQEGKISRTAVRLRRLHEFFPRACARSVRFHALMGLVERERGNEKAARQHLAWSLVLDRDSPKDEQTLLDLAQLEKFAQARHAPIKPRKRRGIRLLAYNIRRLFSGSRRKH